MEVLVSKDYIAPKQIHTTVLLKSANILNLVDKKQRKKNRKGKKNSLFYV